VQQEALTAWQLAIGNWQLATAKTYTALAVLLLLVTDLLEQE